MKTEGNIEQFESLAKRVTELEMIIKELTINTPSKKVKKKRAPSSWNIFVKLYGKLLDKKQTFGERQVFLSTMYRKLNDKQKACYKNADFSDKDYEEKLTREYEQLTKGDGDEGGGDEGDGDDSSNVDESNVIVHSGDESNKSDESDEEDGGDQDTKVMWGDR